MNEAGTLTLFGAYVLLTEDEYVRLAETARSVGIAGRVHVDVPEGHRVHVESQTDGGYGLWPAEETE